MDFIQRHKSYRMFKAMMMAVVLLAFAATAEAKDLSFFVGGTMPGSIEKDGVEIGLDNGPIYGFRFNSDMTRDIGMEHTLAFSSDYLFPSGSTEVLEAKGILYSGNMVINLPLNSPNASPFVTAGIGLIHQYGDRNMPVGNKFAFNYGGGLKFRRLAGPLGARFDLRGYRAGMFSNTVNIFEISFGITASFGR